jgi:hypothetical protein
MGAPGKAVRRSAKRDYRKEIDLGMESDER